MMMKINQYQALVYSRYILLIIELHQVHWGMLDYIRFCNAQPPYSILQTFSVLRSDRIPLLFCLVQV